MSKKIIAGISLLALFACAEVSAETLNEALGSAYATNPTLGAERARQRATDEQVPQALSGWRPQINATASADRSWTTRKTSVFKNGKVTQEYQTNEGSIGALRIQLTQPIFDGFRTVASTQAAEANVRAGRQQLLSVEQDIMFRTVQAYLNVVRDRRILSLRNDNVKVLKEQLRGAKLRFEVGEVTKTDVALSDARLSQARAATSTAMAQLQSSAALYHTLTGHKPGSLSLPKVPRLPKSLEASLTLAHEINPNILAAAQVRDAASHFIDVAKSDLLPSISLNATGTLSDDFEARTGDTTIGRIEGLLEVPIYDGGRTYSAVREAKQVESQRRIEIIEATRSVRESVTSAWNFHISARENIDAAKDQVSAAQQAVAGVREEYLVGSRTTIDVLNAQQELITAKTALVTAERDYIVSGYQVLGTIGKLTAANLGLRVARYDPKTNYSRVRNKLFGADIGKKK